MNLLFYFYSVFLGSIFYFHLILDSITILIGLFNPPLHK
jgi:hypothetical protein